MLSDHISCGLKHKFHTSGSEHVYSLACQQFCTYSTNQQEFFLPTEKKLNLLTWPDNKVLQFTYDMLHITYNLSLMPTATEPHPVNSTTMHSRVVGCLARTQNKTSLKKEIKIIKTL